MIDSAWESETARFIGLSLEERWRWFARLLFALTMLARTTYVVGGDGLIQPERMRRFNELTHRVAQQLADLAAGSQGIPDVPFLKGVGEEIVALDLKRDWLIERLK
jgi:hypothetical protein